jgi:hypothetical protein
MPSALVLAFLTRDGQTPANRPSHSLMPGANSLLSFPIFDLSP